jgi:hypothetical protein
VPNWSPEERDAARAKALAWWTPARRAKAKLAAKRRIAHHPDSKPPPSRYGRLMHRLAPTESATPHDFIWAAGFYEGEGCCNRSTACICQKDPWTLYRMRALFGGSVGPKRNIFQWNVSGARGRGFLMSIYGLLSPRRQEQIRRGLWY